MKTWLFLDIDGVLNHEEWYVKITTGKMPEELSWPICDFDPECVARVNRILEETGATLVVTSTWRIAKDLPEIFERVGLPKEFMVTPRIWSKPRGEEIEMFLKEHDMDTFLCGKNYAILDDDNDFNHWQKMYCLFRTAVGEYDQTYEENGGTGLTEKLTEKVIKHLRKYGNNK